jgi:inorganic triphosphatase YgiF
MARRAKDHQEAELKFELDRRAARKVRRLPPLADSDPQTKALTSQYFDTVKGKVRKAGYSLRVRQADEDYTQTVKTSGGAAAGLFDRGEWEAPVDDLKVDAKALKKSPLGKVPKLQRKLEPQVRADVERETWLIDRDGSLIEVELDSGTVSAEGEKEKFQELEMELRAGEPAALFNLAKQLGQDVPLEIGVLSKEERGRMLGEHALDHEQKAREPDISDKLTVGQTFVAIVQECIRHFRLNQALIIAERDPDALHQARVAMRRLRSAFILFRPAIRQGSLEPLRSELRDFLKPFGTARNLDVYLSRHGEELGWRDRRKLKSARANSYDQVIDALQSQRTRDMMVDLVEWTASDNWRKAVAGDPIGKFAHRRLDRAWKAVKRDASKLADLPEKRLHRLRIDIKELRYSVEFLAPLYPRKRVRQFAASLEAMQDCLGLIHDDMVSREIVADYGLSQTGRTDAAARARQIKKLDGRFSRLKKAGPYW